MPTSTYASRTFPVGSVAASSNIASAKLHWGKRSGANFDMATNGVGSEAMGLIYNKASHMMFQIQDTATPFDAAQLTTFKTAMADAMFSVGTQDAVGAQTATPKPLYLDIFNGEIFTSPTELYVRGSSSSVNLNRSTVQDLFINWSRKKMQTVFKDKIYNASFGTVAEGVDYQNSIRLKFKQALAKADALAFLGKYAEVVPAADYDFLHWPGTFRLIWNFTSWAGDPEAEASFAETYYVRPHVADVGVYSRAEINVTQKPADTNFVYIVATNGKEKGFTGRMWARTNWNDNSNTTWKMESKEYANFPIDDPWNTGKYSWANTTMTEASALKFLDAVGITRKVASEIQKVLLVWHGETASPNVGTGNFPDINYWLTCAQRWSNYSDTLQPMQIPLDPVNTWSTANDKTYMSDRANMKIGYVASRKAEHCGTMNISEAYDIGYTTAGAVDTPLLIVDKETPPRDLVIAGRDVMHWQYTRGDTVEANARNLKVQMPNNFPAAITEPDFVQLGEYDYLFVTVRGMTANDIDWATSHFNGAVVEGNALAVDTTYVGRDALGEPINWEAGKQLLVDNEVFDKFGANIVIPLAGTPPSAVPITVTVMADRSFTMAPVDVTIAQVKAEIAIGTNNVTFVNDAGLTTAYNGNNNLYPSFVLEDGQVEHLAEYIFRADNNMDTTPRETDLAFQALLGWSYLTTDGAYEIDTGVPVLFPRFKLSVATSLQELAISQTGINKGGRALLNESAMLGWNVVANL